MESVKIKARLRDKKGKSYTRKARAAGWIPAVCYGHDFESVKIEVDAKEFASVVRKKLHTHLIELDIDSELKNEKFIVKDYQEHILKDEYYLNVDFQRVILGEKISVKCKVELVGVPVGVKEEGGFLEHLAHELEIKCLPSQIPEKLDVDVSGLHVGDALHVSDLLFEGIEIVSPAEEVVAVVTSKESLTETEGESDTEDSEAAGE